jgi:UDP-N-acetyl-D-galactosamine dehydrogenase
LLIQRDKNPRQAKVLVLGITFKENVADIRNSKVAALVQELQDYSVNVHIVDPHASPNEVAHEYHLTLADKISDGYDAIIVAVAHQEFLGFDSTFFKSISKEKPILMDLKGIYQGVDEEVAYWRL